MNKSAYEIWRIPNGRMSDFRRGITGKGYPNACELWWEGDSESEAISRLREIVEEESYHECYMDEYTANIASPNWDNDESIKAYDEEVEKQRVAFVEDAVKNLGFEYRNDLKFVRVVKRTGDTIEIL